MCLMRIDRTTSESSQLTSTILLIIFGNETSGPRSRLNRANDTNALSAVKIFESDIRTYVANVAMPTLTNTYV